MVSPANTFPRREWRWLFYFNSGQSQGRLACPLIANSGHLSASSQRRKPLTIRPPN
jgi:hypothetical protein